MPIPMGRLWTSSAVAGLLFLLPAGHANAQDNRNTWGWGATRGMLIFIASGAVGSIAGWSVSRLASKGKRGDGNKETILARFDQLDNGVKALNEKLTKLETTSKEEIHGLSRTLESKMNLGSKIHMVSTSLETIGQRIIKVEGMVKAVIEKKENNQLDQCASNSNQAIGIHNNQPRSIIIDTNAIIDGRIFTLLESDLLEELRGPIIIAECVKDELKSLEPQLKANGLDNLYFFQDQDRNQGRINRNNNYESKITDARLLQLTSDTDKELFQDLSDTDKKLFLLTSDTNGICITADHKLVECCRSKNVRVLNLNELNRELNKITNKPSELKIGDEVNVELEESNRNPDDAITRSCGPIIVVKNAGKFVGQTKRVTITGSAQNGRTFFAKLSSPNAEPPTVAAEEPPKTSPAP